MVLIALIVLFNSELAALDYSRGRMAITIKPEYKLNIGTSNDGYVVTGISRLDDLNREYEVTQYRCIVGNHNLTNPRWKRFWNSFIFFFDDKNLDMVEVSNMYESLPEVYDAEPNWLSPKLVTPNDPIFYNQWHLKKIKADSTWNLTKGSDAVIMSNLEGVAWWHNDLAPVVWQNTTGGFGGYGEDADRDGRTLEYIGGDWVFDPDDENGIDDDFNGWVDDLIGYDFITDCDDAYSMGVFTEDGDVMDNNPSDFVLDGHGSHVAGTMIAATNNGFGVAGINWEGKLMVLRSDYYKYNSETGEAEGVSDPAATYLAMAYAIDHGCKVMNFSWGSQRLDTRMRELVREAWLSGIVIVAAAGNDDWEDISYPGNYPNVITVAATDPHDHKADFSNYGNWIEISAPGTGIWSTIPPNAFFIKEGTSMASPTVAGVVGLLISAFPDSSNEWIRNRVIETADTIDHLNPEYSGLLGSGRVNALRAVGPIKYPWLEFIDYTVSDSAYGDNNGRVDPGEEGEIVFSFRNVPGWQTATGVTITISEDDSEVELTYPTGTIPDIIPGESGSNGSDPVRFSFPEWGFAHYLQLSFTVSTAEGFTYSDDMEFIIGRPPILLFDADGGEANFDDYYITPLDEGRMVYDYWNRAGMGEIASSTLNLYHTVIYFTGNLSEGAIPASDQTLLIEYLQGGNNLLITGQYIGDIIGTTTFFTDYLKAEHTDDALPAGYGFNIVGIDGDPVSDGVEISTLGGCGNQVSLSGCSPREEASGVFRYDIDTEPDRYAGIKYHNTTYDYKSVYLGFGLEGIGNTHGDSMRVALYSILEWFGHTPGVDEYQTTKPDGFKLYNYPNPFNERTVITFNLDEPGFASLKVYNLRGQLLQTLVDGYRGPGIHSIAFDASRFESGIYFYRLETPDVSDTGKMILIK